ncbi:hypothetical protein HYPSUDRAFT_138765, partial [Hypholoma sublateritium FD-334 SS-4]
IANHDLAGAVALNPTVDFIAGTVAGMASLVVGFPFDTVKVRFQSPAIAGKYHTTFGAIATIVREERVLGLYKGITSPLATVALMNGLVFASYHFLLKLQLPSADAVPTLAQIALAGAGCGIVSSIVTTPTELVKIRQQARLTPTTARTVAREILREHGVRGLYRGLPVTALRDCGYGAYFAAYEAACRYLPTGADGKLTLPALLIAGGIAGIAGWVATFPLDVVKTRAAPLLPSAGARRLHLTGKSAAAPMMQDINPYRTTWSTIAHSFRTEGASVFWRGLAPTLIRAIPVNMVTFATFEAVVHALA